MISSVLGFHVLICTSLQDIDKTIEILFILKVYFNWTCCNFDFRSAQTEQKVNSPWAAKLGESYLLEML